MCNLFAIRREALLADLANMEAFFVSTNTEVSLVERRMKELEIAMQKARQVQRFPALESYCNVETVWDTALVIKQWYNSA